MASKGDKDEGQMFILPDGFMEDAQAQAHTVPSRLTGSSAPPAPNVLSVYTIFENPDDYPGKWVARRSDVADGSEVQITNDIRVASSLEDCRAMLPPGLHNLGTMGDPNPKVVENWI